VTEPPVQPAIGEGPLTLSSDPTSEAAAASTGGLPGRLARISLPTGRVALIVWSYTALAVIALVVLTARIPLEASIGLPVSVLGIDPAVLGVGLWVLVGLATSARATADEGRVTIVMGVAPIVAALALGGPTAAVWVALLGTFELRELRGDVPWYGVVANHAMLVVPAAAGGLVTLGLRSAGFDDGSQTADFLMVMAGAATLCVLDVGMAVLAVRVRTGRPATEALGIPWRTMGTMMAAESALAWIFAAAYVSIAWWSPAVLVIADAAATSSLDRGRAGWLLRHHQLTLLPNRLALAEHTADLRRSHRSGAAVFYIDLDGFKAVNDRYDHDVGDDVLKVVAQRIGDAKRSEDFVAHLHGDEFVLLAAGVETEAEADAIVDRIVAAAEVPIEHAVGTVRLSASVGYRIVSDLAEVDDALRSADQRMAVVKQARARASGRVRRGA
jgi:diguanylate cyclase (GGDEF)-like protein